jgi:hypothetical protein
LLAVSASPALRKPLTLMADRPVSKALIMSRVHRIMRRMVMSFKNCVIRVVSLIQRVLHQQQRPGFTDI